MVAKITTGSSLYGAVMYNESKVEVDAGEVLLSNRILANRWGDIDAHSTMESFKLHLLNNQNTEKPIVHISLNPHPDDILSDEQLRDIAQEYMAQMGYGKQPYIVYKHTDIERSHIHIVTTNVDGEGRKLSSKNNFYLSKKITCELEQKYGLRSADRKSREERQRVEFSKVDASKGNVKIQIGNVIKPLVASYKFQCLGEYRTLLAQYNICIEESKGERNGNSYEGLIYYATNDRGENCRQTESNRAGSNCRGAESRKGSKSIKVSNPFKSSLYGRAVGYHSIQERCGRNKKAIKDGGLSRDTATRVAEITRGVSDRSRYVELLTANNIDVVFRENSEGRIYGTTFIDHNNHCVFNGSRLGKEFSANAINDRFEGVAQEPTQTSHESMNGALSDNDDGVSFGGLFDLPIESGIDDPEEERFRRAMQRKKKRKIKM